MVAEPSLLLVIGGFAVLLQDPAVPELEQLVGNMLRPFPAGLLTDAGLLVANPVFADAARQRKSDEQGAKTGRLILSRCSI